MDIRGDLKRLGRLVRAALYVTALDVLIAVGATEVGWSDVSRVFLFAGLWFLFCLQPHMRMADLAWECIRPDRARGK